MACPSHFAVVWIPALDSIRSSDGSQLGFGVCLPFEFDSFLGTEKVRAVIAQQSTTIQPSLARRWPSIACREWPKSVITVLCLRFRVELDRISGFFPPPAIFSPGIVALMYLRPQVINCLRSPPPLLCFLVSHTSLNHLYIFLAALL